MKMNHKDALHILSINFNEFISGEDTDREKIISKIKYCYRAACSEYHPDRNPAGLEMMKLVNMAYDSLSDILKGFPFDTSVKFEQEGTEHYGERINEALNAIINLGLNIEICGSWIWVGGDTRQHKNILKESGFKWAPKKMMWNFRPSEYKSYSRGKYDMDQIRSKYGSSNVKNKSYNRLGDNI